ncbi:multidrug effflux MFS transporter [Georgenia sp. Z1344]|uniref:multidrug effflux MFS transporter n=1 Tax=Georgenia sp. Z1344 TaxID=3416706 RepID=UPI003CF0A406
MNDTTAAGTTAASTAPAGPTIWLVATLALLSAVSPLATDMYLPAFPQMQDDLGTTAASVQLTLTAFMVGLALGQLVIGPLSDALGRRGPLLIGTIVCLAASIACVLAPNVTVLVVMRFVQGMSGAAGIVLSRAVITDMTRGARTARLMSLMMVLGGLMPALAPSIGGGILAVGDWRTIFLVVCALVGVMVVLVVVVVPESLPAGRRGSGGLRRLVVGAGEVLRNRTYLFATGVFTLGFAAFFGYISASPFVLQNILGLGELQYAVVFGVNSLGIMATGGLAMRLAGRVPILSVVGVGLALLAAGAVALLVLALVGPTLVPTLVAMFVVAASIGLFMGNSSAIAMQALTSSAGTGSAVLGAAQFLLAGLISPIVGINGEDDAVPMGLVLVVGSALAWVSYLALRREPAGSDRTTTNLA